MLRTEPRVFIGTSGWSYPDWKTSFYPKDVPQRRFLEYYATRFAAVELNASFYRLPTRKMLDGWLEHTGTDFRFCAKLSRLITHQKKLQSVDESLAVFLDRFKPLKRRMGPVLAQLPATQAFDKDRIHRFLRSWRRRTRLRLVIEARHRSWFSDAAFELFKKYNVALAHADSGNRWPATEEITADFVYRRYHGPQALYASAYSPQSLGADASKITHWLDEGREAWIFFNNTEAGHAWHDAQRLRRLLDNRL